MRKGIPLAILAIAALSLLAAPVAAAPDYQGIADDLRSGDAMRIGDAGRALAVIPHEARLAGASIIVPALVELFGHEHVGVRATALRMITMFRDGPVDIWTPVAALTTDPDPLIRASALDALATLCGDSPEKQKSLLPHLLVALADPDWEVRREAGESAAELTIPIETLIPPLTATLETVDKALARKDPELVAETRCAVIAALGKTGAKAAPAKEALFGALSDQDAGVRAAAGETLGKIGKTAKAAAKRALLLIRPE